MTDKLKDQASSLPPAVEGGKKIAIGKATKGKQVTINPPEKVDTNQGGIRERFQQALKKHTVILEKKTELVLQSKAARAALPEEVLKQVFVRGYKNLPLNTELTREQYAMNRVNSFIAGGAALQEDYDLIPIMERIGMKGSGGAMRPHIKAVRNVYNNRMVYHVVNAKGQIKHTASDKWAAKKHLAQKYHSYMNEEAEQIDELSKSTLGSYVKKSARDMSASRKIATDFEHKAERAKSPSMKGASTRLADRFKNIVKKRNEGIGKAVERLTKEEVVSEGYSEDDVANGGTVIYKHDGKHYMSKVSHKTGGGAGTKIYTTSKLGHVVPLNHVVSTDASDWNTFKNRTVKEEAEQIDEISTDGYHKAAVKSRQDAAVKVMGSMGQDKQAKTKLDARNKGLKRLSDRTSAEMKKANSGPQLPRPTPKEPTEAERRGYGQGRYMGDSVEVEGELIEAKKSAAVRWQEALQRAKQQRETEEFRKKENEKRALAPRPPQEKS